MRKVPPWWATNITCLPSVRLPSVAFYNVTSLANSRHSGSPWTLLPHTLSLPSAVPMTPRAPSLLRSAPRRRAIPAHPSAARILTGALLYLCMRLHGACLACRSAWLQRVRARRAFHDGQLLPQVVAAARRCVMLRRLGPCIRAHLA